jgi:hypothetical protein
MIKIDSLYNKYFQKSKVLLYPALNINRGVSVTPIQTFVAWKGYFTTEDRKLCSLYYERNDLEFKNFETKVLKGNPLYHNSEKFLKDINVYIFSFDSLKRDWDMFIAGKYSKFTEKHKNNILNYYKANSANYAFIESYLYPERFFTIYAELLGVSIQELKEVGELCSKPDFDKEILETSEQSYGLNKNNV